MGKLFISESEKRKILVMHEKARTIKESTLDSNAFNSNSSLLFDGEYLHWITNGSIVKSWDGVSGRTWKNTPLDLDSIGKLAKGYFSSEEEFSKEKDFGPIPPGLYTVGPLESRQGNTETVSSLEAAWEKLTGGLDNVTDAQKQFQNDSLFSRIGWGNHRAKITSKEGTETYGRSGFFIHGGSIEGSMGCIDLSDEMDDFAKYYGTWLATTKKNGIILKVNYD